jgi:glutathione S-transferase
VTLWPIPISHYSEKVRWALSLKGVEHVRHAPPPGSHIPVALALTRGRHYTFPVLSVDGRHVGDSTAIIAALEESFPDPPLYPADPADRDRALALEDFFDEELGPYVRQAVFHELGSDPESFARVAAAAAPAPLARLGGALGAYGRAYTAVRFRASDGQAAVRSRTMLGEALDRLEAELGDDDYLVGDRFTVADLTAAALLYPIVLPPGGPLSRDELPRGLGLRSELGDRSGLRWVETIYARHRRASAARASAT